MNLPLAVCLILIGLNLAHFCERMYRNGRCPECMEQMEKVEYGCGCRRDS